MTEDLIKTLLKTAVSDDVECKSYIIIVRDILGGQKIKASADVVEALGMLEHCKMKIVKQINEDGKA